MDDLTLAAYLKTLGLPFVASDLIQGRINRSTAMTALRATLDGCKEALARVEYRSTHYDRLNARCLTLEDLIQRAGEGRSG